MSLSSRGLQFRGRIFYTVAVAVCTVVLWSLVTNSYPQGEPTHLLTRRSPEGKDLEVMLPEDLGFKHI